MNGKVRIFIQPLGRNAGAFELARGNLKTREIDRLLRPLPSQWGVSVCAPQDPRQVLGRQLHCATGGGR